MIVLWRASWWQVMQDVRVGESQLDTKKVTQARNGISKYIVMLEDVYLCRMRLQYAARLTQMYCIM